MQAVPAHPVPAGPLAVRWLGYEARRAPGGRRSGAHASSSRTPAAPPGATSSSPTTGSTTSATRSTGTACARRASRSRPATAPRVELDVRGLIPPGRYRLAFDLVLEHRYWLSEIGNELARRRASRSRKRDARRTRSRTCPPRGRAGSRTGTSSSARRTRRATPPSAARSTRAAARELARVPRPAAAATPRFTEPLVCPSLMPPLQPNCDGRRPARLAAGDGQALALRAVDLRRAGSELDCDLVVDAAEDPRAERERDRRRDARGRRRPTRPAARRRRAARAAPRSPA